MHNIPYQRLFKKNHAREVLREFFKDQNYIRIPEEEMEHNIEWLESVFMRSMISFTTGIHKLFITAVCYRNIVEGKEDSLSDWYVEHLNEKVKNLFLGFSAEKDLKTEFKFEEYLCTKTIPEYFYEGEVYKYFKFRGLKGKYGERQYINGFTVKEECLCLVPQGGKHHIVITEDIKDNFKLITK